MIGIRSKADTLLQVPLRRLTIMAGLRMRNPAQIPSDMFTWLAGQQVKVKNTFLDDVLPDHSSSNESTLTGEAMTCPPEFTRRRSDGFSSSSGSHGAGDLARDRMGQTPVVEPLCTQGIDDFRRATLETQQLLAALQVVEPLCTQGIDDFRRATLETQQLLAALQAIEVPLRQHHSKNPLHLEWSHDRGYEHHPQYTPSFTFAHSTDFQSAAEILREGQIRSKHVTPRGFKGKFEDAQKVILEHIEAMPALPFTDLVLGSHPPLQGHHVDVPMPLLPEVAGPPAVLSTLPCCRDADYSAWKPAGAEAEVVEPLNSDSDKASPLSSASPGHVHVDGLSNNGAGYAAKAKAKPTKKHNPAQKIWCHFFIDPTMLRNGFDVNKKLIGHGGANTKRIYEETGAKIRLRGRGSGHHEGDRGEAPVPLMLAVTSDMRNQDNFLVALDMSAQLLQTVTNKYPDFCKAHGIPVATSPLFWVGELSQEALSCLSWVSESKVQIGKVPVAILADVSSPTKRAAAKSKATEALQ
ncbi:hypothetical protein AK812_SmicGene34240 [Symbiodinium microadriaticum]|uniref:KHDC4/BBP-like KH-domain type I domain-containing protein n=1 Tax=Symbiodinium microadriaticum TaxID=2951 RepID=A0A1Q9CPI3_SYMMI|nr:hypothetical protein AK812_SmicGene34240 [Symbiodinium microadriaticum]